MLDKLSRGDVVKMAVDSGGFLHSEVVVDGRKLVLDQDRFGILSLLPHPSQLSVQLLREVGDGGRGRAHSC